MAKSSYEEVSWHVADINDGLLEPPKYDDVIKRALLWNIRHIDEVAPAGVNIKEGELIVIQGRKKHRKTTMALNLVRNWCKQANKLGGTICWETLESGQTPRKVKQLLICMEATAYMCRRIWGDISSFPMVRDGVNYYTNMNIVRDATDPALPNSRQGIFRLSPGYASSVDRTPLQHEALLYAREEVNTWPLLITGATAPQGSTKRLELNENGRAMEDCLPFKRWQFLVDKLGVKIVVLDHVNAYTGSGSDYDRQSKGVTHVSSGVSELGLVIVAVCQVSMTSLRQDDQPEARGGTKYAEEANRVINVKYVQDDWRIRIECSDSREAPFPDIWVPLDRASGLFFPYSYPAKGAKYDGQENA